MTRPTSRKKQSEGDTAALEPDSCNSSLTVCKDCSSYDQWVVGILEERKAEETLKRVVGTGEMTW